MIQVCPLFLSVLPCSLQGVAHGASAPSRSKRNKHKPLLLPLLYPPFPVPRLGLCPPNHGQEPCLLWLPRWPHQLLARISFPLPLPAPGRSPDLDSGTPCRAPQPAGLAHLPFLGKQERVWPVRIQTRSRLVLDLGVKPTDTPHTAKRRTA